MNQENENLKSKIGEMEKKVFRAKAFIKEKVRNQIGNLKFEILNDSFEECGHEKCSGKGWKSGTGKRKD